MSILFLFRRDLRTYDNLAFHNAVLLSHKLKFPIIPIFIFNHIQLFSQFSSHNSIQFMLESLNDLNSSLNKKLTCFYKKNMKNDLDILNNLNISHIFFNSDLTPFAKQRDNIILEWANIQKIEVHTYEDYSLHPANTVLSSSNKFYEVFTFFKNKALNFPVDKPRKLSHSPLLYKYNDNNNHIVSLEKAFKLFLPNGINTNIKVHGGSTNAYKILNNINLHNYSNTRNILSINTSLLSAYIKYGNISIREVYFAFKDVSHDLLIQLFWREFYYILMDKLPFDRTIGKSNYKQISIKWPHLKTSHWNAWCNGNTGFPLVDAGMRQLNYCGWMHNRARMICANFLVFILHINWKKGEQYFASKLVDYDISQNNGNWQWNSGVGVDKSGYLRIFNPFSQSSKFDKNCSYIFTWIPELSSVPIKDIHSWETSYSNHTNINYPPPIVDFSVQRNNAKTLFKNKKSLK